jgi:hypothetical protein
MTKHQILIRSDRGLEEPLRLLAPRLLALGAERLKLTSSIAPPRLSLIPFSRSPIALLSIWSADAPLEAWARTVREALPEASLAGYRVEESTPRGYSRDWPDGEPTPGVGLLSLFRKPPALARDAFLRAWHGHHTPLSLEIHPLWGYVRNVVEAPLLPGSASLDAIVEEHFRERRDLLNPLRFFGGPLAMLPNMVRVALDIRRFIELRSMETYLTRERWLRG